MLLLPLIVVCLLTKATTANLMAGGNSGWYGLPSYGGTGYSPIGLQDLSSFGSYSSYGAANDLQVGASHGLNTEDVQHALAQAVSEHVEVTKPVAVPVVKNIGIPVAQPVAITVPHPIAVSVPQPYPIHVPVAQPIAVPIVKTIAVPVEKRVPYPVERIIPVPVEKSVPITVEKHIPVPVEKPYPIHIPVYKHVFYRKKKSHSRHGHSRGWIY